MISVRCARTPVSVGRGGEERIYNLPSTFVSQWARGAGGTPTKLKNYDTKQGLRAGAAETIIRNVWHAIFPVSNKV